MCGFILIVKCSGCFSLQGCFYFIWVLLSFVRSFIKTGQGEVLDQTELLEYSRRFHIYDSGTTRMVWIRMFFVWKVFGSMKVEAMSCKDEWLGTEEMFCEDL